MPTPDRTSLVEIVDAARDLIETGGFARLTMQAVAERVGVRPPSLYKRVRDRDALLLLVAQATVDDLARRLAASDGSLPGVARAYRAFAHERPEGFRLMFTVDGAADSLDRVSAPILLLGRDLAGRGCCARGGSPDHRLGDGVHRHGAVGSVPARRGRRPGVRVRARAPRDRPRAARSPAGSRSVFARVQTAMR